MAQVHTGHYSNYGGFQSIVCVIGVFIDHALNNAPHRLLHWIEILGVRRPNGRGYVIMKISRYPALLEHCVRSETYWNINGLPEHTPSIQCFQGMLAAELRITPSGKKWGGITWLSLLSTRLTHKTRELQGILFA